MIVYTKLKRIRQNIGLTQVEVAKEAQISERYYQQLEAGTSKPTVDIAIMIAKALKSTVEEIFNIE